MPAVHRIILKVVRSKQDAQTQTPQYGSPCDLACCRYRIRLSIEVLPLHSEVAPEQSCRDRNDHHADTEPCRPTTREVYGSTQAYEADPRREKADVKQLMVPDCKSRAVSTHTRDEPHFEHVPQ